MSSWEYEQYEAQQEAHHRSALLGACRTVDEVLEVARGLIPDQVRRRYEATHRLPEISAKERP